MPDWLATSLGLAAMVYLPWAVLGAAAPATAVRLWPRAFQACFADDRFRAWFLLGTGLVLFTASASVGAAIAAPTDDPTEPRANPLVAALLTGSIFGGIGIYAATRVTEVAARRSLASEVEDEPLRPETAADSADVPAHDLPSVRVRDRAAHRPHRAVRRFRAVALAAIPVTFLLARGVQFTAGTDDPWTPRLGGLWVLCVLVAAACTVLLRSGRRVPDAALRQLARTRGWTFRARDGARLAQRFPSAGLMTVLHRGEAVSARTVDARSGERLWWMTEQRGELRADRSAPLRSARSTSWVVWLPRTWLPTLSIYGSDDARAAEWVAERTGFELEAFNRGWIVRHGPDHAAYAHAVVHPRLIELVTRAMPDGTRLRLSGDVAVLTREGGLPPDELEDHAAFLLAVVDLIPRHVLRDHEVVGTAGQG